jgi:hypothetical protein
VIDGATGAGISAFAISSTPPISQSVILAVEESGETSGLVVFFRQIAGSGNAPGPLQAELLTLPGRTDYMASRVRGRVERSHARVPDRRRPSRGRLE